MELGIESSAMWSKRRAAEYLSLGIILITAAYFRWTGLAWDSGYLFHPDERQILLVVSSLHLPTNPLELFSAESPLNPKFFAYGSFPIYLLRVLTPIAPPTGIVGPWADDQLARWALFGRWLSGLFDLGTIVLTYLLGRRVYGARVGLTAAGCVAVTVLHVQLSHFYAVDTLVTLLMLATLYSAFRIAQETMPEENRREASSNKGRPLFLDWKFGCGVCFGLALATKITALPLILPILYACHRATNAPRVEFSRARLGEIWRIVGRPLTKIVGIALVVFVVTQPYVLIDWYAFGSDVIREGLVARGWLDYPYTRQYAGTIPFVYQVTQVTLWGMGLPLGLFAWGGGALFIRQWWKRRGWRDGFVLSFAAFYFVSIGLQYTKYLRYLLPLLPVLYIMAACAFARVFARRRYAYAPVAGAVIVLAALYTFAFLQMYAREHPWLTASRWIYANVRVGDTLVVEQWDDALPTLIRDPGGERRGSDYTQIRLPAYDDDTKAKRGGVADALSRADFVIVASQRLYGSTGRLSERYPMMHRYYTKLLNGELGFEPVMTARNDPNLGSIVIRDDPFAGLEFDFSKVQALESPGTSQVWNWGFADESFSVYDHPQPIVFRKVKRMSARELEDMLR